MTKEELRDTLVAFIREKQPGRTPLDTLTDASQALVDAARVVGYDRPGLTVRIGIVSGPYGRSDGHMLLAGGGR